MSRKKNQKQQKSFTNVIVMSFMIFFVAAVTINLGSQLKIYSSLNSNKNNIIREIEKERAKSIELANKNDYFTSDAYIEKIAREQLGLVKSDEILFINRSN